MHAIVSPGSCSSLFHLSLFVARAHERMRAASPHALSAALELAPFSQASTCKTLFAWQAQHAESKPDCCPCASLYSVVSYRLQFNFFSLLTLSIPWHSGRQPASPAAGSATQDDTAGDCVRMPSAPSSAAAGLPPSSWGCAEHPSGKRWRPADGRHCCRWGVAADRTCCCAIPSSRLTP